MLYKLILCFNVQRFTNQANYDFYSTCLRNPFLENRAELSVSHPTCVPIKEAQLERSMTYLLVLKRSYVHSFVLKLDMHKDNVHLKSYNKWGAQIATYRRRLCPGILTYSCSGCSRGIKLLSGHVNTTNQMVNKWSLRKSFCCSLACLQWGRQSRFIIHIQGSPGRGGS
jgi:hypothetical protein